MNQPVTDSELLTGALQGDQRAFGRLYHRHRPGVQHLVLSRVGDLDEAQDVVQVIFVRAFLGLDSYRGDAAFSTWLTRIALNVTNSHLRRRMMARRWMESAEDPEFLPDALRESAWSGNPEEVLVRKQEMALSLQTIEALPEKYRQPVWMRYVEDRSYLEIVEAFQVPIGTVKIWIHRGRLQLRESLAG